MKPWHPLAWHFTWTTYGSWLPGDGRGWRRRGDPDRHAPDPALEAAVKDALRFPPMYFDVAQRAVAGDAIRASCARRGWPLHALEVRRAHVHVVTAAPHAAKQVLRALKADVTRALVEREPALRARVIWTRGGWIRTIGAHVDVDDAIGYVYDDHHTPRRR